MVLTNVTTDRLNKCWVNVPTNTQYLSTFTTKKDGKIKVKINFYSNPSTNGVEESAVHWMDGWIGKIEKRRRHGRVHSEQEEKRFLFIVAEEEIKNSTANEGKGAAFCLKR